MKKRTRPASWPGALAFQGDESSGWTAGDYFLHPRCRSGSHDLQDQVEDKSPEGPDKDGPDNRKYAAEQREQELHRQDAYYGKHREAQNGPDHLLFPLKWPVAPQYVGTFQIVS